MNETATAVNDYIAAYHLPDVKVFIVGHSAGGLLSLKIAGLVKAPVQRIVTMGTPFLGSPVANAFTKTRVRRVLLDLLDTITFKVLDLGAVKFVNTANATDFLSEVRLPEHVKVQTVFGVQRKNRSILPSRRAEFLSLIYVPLQFLMPRYSDGVVTPESAYPSEFQLQTQGGQQINFELLTEVELDHTELVVDSRTLWKLLRTRNPDYIADQQRQLYQRLISDFAFSN